MQSKELLEMVVKAADGRRAEDIVAPKVDQISLMADYFVIMTGSSNRQVQAIANAIVEKAHEQHVEIGSVEGKEAAQWILVDLGTWSFTSSAKKPANFTTWKSCGPKRHW